MPDRLIRTFGASAILLVIVVAGILQLYKGEDPTASEIAEAELESKVTTATDITDSTDVADLAEMVDTPFTYRVGILEGISTTNFWSYFGSSPTVWDAYVLAPTKGSLYRVDPVSLDLETELSSGLVEPESDEEGWKVLITVRGDLRWSDGQPLTAEDVVFTFDTVRNLKLGGQWADAFPGEVASIIALDSYHLVVRFNDRPTLTVWPYGVGTAPIMAKHVWGDQIAALADAGELYALDGSQDVAGGPLELLSAEPDRIVSRANPEFDGESADLVDYRVLGSEENMVSALTTGQVDTILSPKGLSPEQADQLATTKGVKVLTNPKFGVRYLGFNLDREPMDKIEFRRAVSALVDRETLATEIAGVPFADSLLNATQTGVVSGQTADSTEGETPADQAKTLAHSITALEAVGYTWTKEPVLLDGKLVAGEGLAIDGRPPAPLTILTSGDSYDPARPRYAESIAASIELLGFKVIPVTTDFATVVDLTFSPDETGKLRYDMVLLGWSLGNPGHPSFYGDLFGTDGSANNTGYSSTQMDELIGAHDLAVDGEEAIEIRRQIEAVIAQDLPYLPLYGSQIIEAYRSDRVSFRTETILGGIQAALGGVSLVSEQR